MGSKLNWQAAEASIAELRLNNAADSPSLDAAFSPYIVAIGGTARANSTTEQALRFTLAAAAAVGAQTAIVSGVDLELPIYIPGELQRTPKAVRLVAELQRADGIVIGSPGYHGGISGLVKNALDYAEDLRGERNCYFDNRAVGCIATGSGWQAAVATMRALRDVVHALRGWNTPIGVAINTAEFPFEDGRCKSERLNLLMEEMARQIVHFARMRHAVVRVQGRIIDE